MPLIRASKLIEIGNSYPNNFERIKFTLNDAFALCLTIILSATYSKTAAKTNRKQAQR